MKHHVALLIMLGALAACGLEEHVAAPEPATAAAQNESERLDRLVDEYFERLLELNPVFATSLGDLRYNDRFPVDISKQWLADALAVEQGFLARANELDATKLDEASRLTYDVFKYQLQLSIDGFAYRDELLPINQFSSVPVDFGRLGSGDSIQPFTTAKEYDDFLKRMDGFTRWIDQAIVNMREGANAGIVQPRVVVEKALPQIESFVATDAKQSLFYRPIENLPSTVNETDRKRLTAAYEKAIREKITPAYRRLGDFLKNDYLPIARQTVGMSALPQGPSWYAYQARRSTTTDLSPEQIHEIGVKEMARIQGEMERVKAQVGFNGDLKAFIQSLRTDKRFVFKTPQELIAGYDALREQVTAELPKLFAAQPKMPFEVRPVESFRERSAATGSYEAGMPDGSRPGVFYANTYDLASRPSYMMEAIFLHEALPGHHMQTALQYEAQSLPRFRRFGGYTAYDEGWGLYAESLGKELGMYKDPYQYFGSLTAEAWRAARLVVDTGIHAKGWTREQGIDYMLENTAIGEADAVAEVERYIAVPGQALAYKVGQLKIRELRTRVEKALGRSFDVRDFHTQILMDGSLPLAVLEDKIDRWIAAKK